MEDCKKMTITLEKYKKSIPLDFRLNNDNEMKSAKLSCTAKL